ncbi:MAG: nuclear transport factor 2 family protein [Burkholderiaceae bacterium]
MHASPDDAEQAFYEALEHANLEALMDLWSEDDEIVCIHPGGPRLVGHAAIRAGWKSMFANGPVHARRVQIQVAQGPLSAVHSLIEQVIVAQQGETRVVNVFATNVYFKGPQGWRLVLHHASLTPPEHATLVAGGQPRMLH